MLFLEFFNPTFNYQNNNYFISRMKPSTFFCSNIPLNLRGCTLKLAYSKWQPYIIDMYNKDMAGIEGQLAYLIAEKFNIRYDMYPYNYLNGNTLHLASAGETLKSYGRNFKLYVSQRFISNNFISF